MGPRLLKIQRSMDLVSRLEEARLSKKAAISC